MGRATGSVALKIAPSSKAAVSENGVVSATMMPISSVESNRPGTASVNTGPRF